MPSSTSGIKDGTDLCIPNTFSAEASAEPFFSRVEYNIELFAIFEHGHYAANQVYFYEYISKSWRI